MKNKLLLGQCYRRYYQPYHSPSRFKERLITECPGIEEWAKPEIFSQFEDWPDDVTLDTDKEAPNIAGNFLKANIQTPCKVLDGCATPEMLLEELEKDNYTHVGLGIFVAAYNTFIECAKAVRENYPDIVLIAGNVGAMFEGTERYVDLICRGRGVPFLRKLFNENLAVPYKPGLIMGTLRIKYKKQIIHRNLVDIVTKIGCPEKCDFCVTNKYFNGEFSGELVTPKEVHDSLVNHRKFLGNKDFTVYFNEPTAITNHKWWYELIELFEDEPGDYPIIMPTTASSLKNFDLESTMNSALRIDLVNIGIESFDNTYRKNNHIDLAKLIKRLSEHGVAVFATYIIGFPYQTEKDIWGGIDQLLKLNAAGYGILNLKVLPGTDTWKTLKAQGKLLDLQNAFYYLNGFQSFRHDHFRPGFVDIWPLIFRIYLHIEKESGNLSNAFYVLMKNLVNKKAKNWRLFKRNMKLYQMISKSIFPAWKEFFKPSEEQIRNYLKQIDDFALLKDLDNRIRKSVVA